MNMGEFGRIAVIMLPDMEEDVERMEKGLMFASDHLEEAAAAYAQIEAGAGGTKYADAVEKLVYMLGCMLSDIALICNGLLMRMDTVAVSYIVKSLKDLTPVRSREAVEAVEEGPIPPMTLLRRIYEMAGKAVQSDE